MIRRSTRRWFPLFMGPMVCAFFIGFVAGILVVLSVEFFDNIAKVDDAVKMRLRIDRADVFVRMIREIRHSRSRKQREAEIVRLPECMELFCQRPAIVRKMWFHMDASIYI